MTTQLPPGPPRHAAATLWNTIRYARDPVPQLRAWRDTYGDPFTVSLSSGTVVFTGRPDMIEVILRNRAKNYKVFAPESTLLGTNSLLLLDGDAHKRERKLLAPLFHGERVKTHGTRVVEATRRHFAAAPKDTAVSIYEISKNIMMELILQTVYGVLDPVRLASYVEGIENVLDALNPLFLFLPSLQREFGGFGPWARYQRHAKHADELFFAQIARARASGGEGDDVLSMLVQARYEDGEGLTDEALRDELRTLLLAGHETSAITASWVFYALHDNPDALERLMEELETVDDPLEMAKLPYLDACCKESQRLYPLITEVMRSLQEPLQLGEHLIPAGMAVAPCLSLVHKSPDVYADPEAFLPERFLEGSFSRSEYLPFGGGHRQCVGKAFANLGLRILVGTALKEWSFEPAWTAKEVPVRQTLLLAPRTGIPMRIKARS